jgi:hypothetical protein
MTIRKIHSNDVTNNRADIATQYTDLFFDDVTNSLLLPDPTGLLETKIGAVAGNPSMVSGYVNAGTFITLDNIKASVTTGGTRGLCMAAVAGSFTCTVAGHYAYSWSSSEGTATQYPGWTITTTPSGSFFNWSFGNAGDTSVYWINDYNNKKCYRVTLIIGAGYNNNFISIERLS